MIPWLRRSLLRLADASTVLYSRDLAAEMSPDSVVPTGEKGDGGPLKQTSFTTAIRAAGKMESNVL
jgi:hypothetical protein